MFGILLGAEAACTFHPTQIHPTGENASAKLTAPPFHESEIEIILQNAFTFFPPHTSSDP